MRLIAVRFGNVLASNGSVVPKFKAQIDAGGPVTVTHPDMVRYFMTIREACDLVVTAASHALGPDRSDVSVYVLNMGQPVKIVDLAERMIRLAGLEPGRDIDIVYTGMRPGERMHEILFAREEPMVDVGFDGVVAARPVQPSLDAMRGWLAMLEQGLAREEREAIYRVLTRSGAGFPRRRGLNHRGKAGTGIVQRLPTGGDQFCRIDPQIAADAVPDIVAPRARGAAIPDSRSTSA